MGTRAVISFHDTNGGEFNVYQHWDGDPETVIANIMGTFSVQMCWEWPRWEADEFAAAYIAANKSGSGNLRIARSIAEHGDLAYSYIVRQAGERLVVTYLNHYEDRMEEIMLEPKEIIVDAA